MPSIAAVGMNDDVLRGDVRRFDVDLSACCLLEQTGADAGEQLIRRPYLDLAGQRRDFGRRQQIGEVRIEGEGVVIVEGVTVAWLAPVVTRAMASVTLLSTVTIWDSVTVEPLIAVIVKKGSEALGLKVVPLPLASVADWIKMPSPSE